MSKLRLVAVVTVGARVSKKVPMIMMRVQLRRVNDMVQCELESLSSKNIGVLREIESRPKTQLRPSG